MSILCQSILGENNFDALAMSEFSYQDPHLKKKKERERKKENDLINYVQEEKKIRSVTSSCTKPYKFHIIIRMQRITYKLNEADKQN